MSDAHHDALMRHLGATGNKHEQSKPPANPAKVINAASKPVVAPANPARAIGSSTTDEADDALLRLTPTQRKHYERRAREGKNMKGNYGGFEQLKRDLHQEKVTASLAKSYPNGIPTGERTNDFDAADIIKKVKAMPKATIVSSTAILKSLEKTRESLGKALAVDTRAAVEPSVTVTRSDVLKAASLALHEGAIDGATAGVIEARINAGDVDDGLLKALSPYLETMLKSDAPVGTSSLEASYDTNAVGKTGGAAIQRQSLDKKRVYTRDQVLAKASDALAKGKITAAQAQHINTHCAMGHDVPDDLLKALDYDE